MLRNAIRYLFIDTESVNSYIYRNLKRNVKTSKKVINTNLKMQRVWQSVSSTTDAAGQTTDAPKRQMKQVNTFKLLSYNILAQDLLIEHIDLYRKIDPQFLRWDHRLRRLREEVAFLKPDIMCIQEMQFNHIKEFVRNIRQQRKMEYIFKKKTGHRTDGCAIIYDRSKFKLIEEQGVEYYTPDRAMLNRENIALLAKLCLRDEPSKQMVVATTHLLYNPKRDDVRVAQVCKLLKALNAFAMNPSQSDHKSHSLPIILTGDFNSQPFTSPYNQLTSSIRGQFTKLPLSQMPSDQTQTGNAVMPSPVIDLTVEDTCDMTDLIQQECATEKPTEPSSPLSSLESTLQLSVLDFGAKGCSTFQNRWIVVDYILKSISTPNRSDIKVWSVYKLPLVQDCYRIGGIPNHFIGSDHYSLAMCFSIL